MRIPAIVAIALLLAGSASASPAAAVTRVQVFSLERAVSADCGRDALKALRAYRGVRKATFDPFKVEITATLAGGVSDMQIVEMIQKSCVDGVLAVPGAGLGAYLKAAEYPAGSDVRTLGQDGAAVGPLERLRVPGKLTLFDVYADWCAPCRGLDARLSEFIGGRGDVAIRRLNVVSFRSELARELGPRLTQLPYVVVFAPDGRRRDFAGASWKQLAPALGGR